uniref:Type III potassium channel toxin protein n=1 Tax=Anemonia sulcata TaxID=6108 RepID=A0A0S1M193_ANESU|nr:type III potassium channel toxin protein [Anemonia sulcata]
MAMKILLILVLCMASVFLSNGVEVTTRGFPCRCGRNDPVGDRWFWRRSCPGGYNYKGSCRVLLDVCCYPNHGEKV